ncbi:MAG: class A beta-lactamase-related serine hydrolase [Candidatus Doudnabacteria bacterium]|nr:class A beta-lactamase-related serine hydrolase [Candidatus Doudnabacteria bacterium]
MNFSWRTAGIVIVIGLLVGFGAGRSYPWKKDGQMCSSVQLSHINQDLICAQPFVVDKSAYESLQIQIDNFIKTEEDSKELAEAAVYFRDLDDGPTFGINEYATFSPASLLKLPLLLAYLNLAEDKPELLDQKLTYELINDPYVPEIKPKEPIEPGKVYTVEQLLEHMTKFSDNKAYFVLRQYLHNLSPDKDLLASTYQDLGITDPKDPLDNTISVKSYAAIFVQVYHGSFFRKRETAERALALLIESDYSQGIKAGVPEGIEVAHKFGERQAEDGRKQFHDCGIVFYPENPYLVCIMTRGSDFQKLVQISGEISKMIYEEFDSRKL